MTVKRGDIWLADLNPIRGSEQAGTRPVLVFQNDDINQFTTTILAIPLTTNLRRAALPSCVQIAKGEGGLSSDSVALCHQLRALDKSRLMHKIGTIKSETMAEVEGRALFTLGIVV
jgi:mRNA interferase MazF